jgi:hypothetical protein
MDKMGVTQTSCLNFWCDLFGRSHDLVVPRRHAYLQQRLHQCAHHFLVRNCSSGFWHRQELCANELLEVFGRSTYTCTAPRHKGLPGIKLNLKDVLCPFAQGGGGSFKDRKTIGGVSCGEAWMAERTQWWTERWLRLWVSLSLSPSLFVSIYLFACLSIYLSDYLPWSLSLPWSL